MQSIFSIDVEDWFHLLDMASTPDLEAWDSLPSRVEANFARLLELLAESGTRATCFFLGYVGARFPHLVRQAAAAGHEIASHGYAHRLVYEQTAGEFRDDVVKARQILEDVSGAPVIGYRAPGFSGTVRTPWFFDQLVAAGYHYDSSVFPARHGHGGLLSSPCAPHILRLAHGDLVELPISVAEVAGRRLCFFGGGYLRLFPLSLIRSMARSVTHEGRPVVFYVHPREVDPDQPRLPQSALRSFRSYVNLHTVEPKVRELLRAFPCSTFSDFIATHASTLEVHTPCPHPAPRHFSMGTPLILQPSTAASIAV